jgi:hypothetical protein
VITGPQIRAARGFLAWDRRDLAKKAVVTLYTVERIETGTEMSATAVVKGLAAIKAALEAERIEFTDDGGVPGVRLHLKRANASKIRSGSRCEVADRNIDRDHRICALRTHGLTFDALAPSCLAFRGVPRWGVPRWGVTSLGNRD